MTSPTRLDTALFWDAAQRQSLAAVRCAGCGALSHPPTARCANCGERQPQTFPVEGRGRLYASTVVERQTDPRWPVPYTIVLVDVAGVPGMRLAGSLQGRWSLETGQEMEAWFERRPDGSVIPQWRPVAAQSESGAPPEG